MNIGKFCPLPLCALVGNFHSIFVYCFSCRYHLVELGLRQLGLPVTNHYETETEKNLQIFISNRFRADGRNSSMRSSHGHLLENCSSLVLVLVKMPYPLLPVFDSLMLIKKNLKITKDFLPLPSQQNHRKRLLKTNQGPPKN